MQLRRAMDGSGSKLAEAHRLFGRLETAVKARNYDTAKSFIKTLKKCLVGLTGLPPTYEQTSSQAEELKLARAIFEQAVLLAVLVEDLDYFEVNFLQLKPFYTDVRDLIPASANESLILGLNLLRLLVQNRIAEFHTELELLPAEVLRHDCIKYVVELEQALMEGAYSHVLAGNSRKDYPNEAFRYFMELLADTVSLEMSWSMGRDEVAGCSEKAYDYLTVEDAKKVFSFTRDQELLEFIKTYHPGWEIRNSRVYFQEDATPCRELPSLQLINQTLGYARELERIV